MVDLLERDLRGDINQQLLLMLGFLCLDTSLFGLDHSLFLNLFIELTFRNIGLDISRCPMNPLGMTDHTAKDALSSQRKRKARRVITY